MHTTYKGLELLVDKKEWETKLKKKSYLDVYVQAWRRIPVCSGPANIRRIISKLFHPYHSPQLIYIARAATERLTKQISWHL